VLWRAQAEAAAQHLVWDLVEQGIGIAVMPASAPHGNHHIARIPIVRPRLQVRIVLAAGPDLPSPATRAFLEIATHQASPQQP
jgi:DNA-binding transcriptional LysR family regulator